ncbi:MAG: hypothetical protein R3A80_10445 [Bdellovibrionota bacterium]
MLQRVCLILLLLASCSISGPLRVDKSASGYFFPPPEAGWTQLAPQEGAEVLYQNKNGALLSVSSICERYEESSLESLARSALTPIKHFKDKDAGRFQLDGREAFQVYGAGKVDGVEVEIDFVAWRKDECLFDFSVQASPSLNSSTRASFLKMLKKFRYPK